MKSASTLFYKYALKVGTICRTPARPRRARTRRNDSVVPVRRRQETFFRAKAPLRARRLRRARSVRDDARGRRAVIASAAQTHRGRSRRARSEGSPRPERGLTRERHRELTNEVSTYLARPKHEGLGRPCSCGARAGHLCRRVHLRQLRRFLRRRFAHNPGNLRRRKRMPVGRRPVLVRRRSQSVYRFSTSSARHRQVASTCAPPTPTTTKFSAAGSTRKTTTSFARPLIQGTTLLRQHLG